MSAMGDSLLPQAGEGLGMRVRAFWIKIFISPRPSPLPLSRLRERGDKVNPKK